MEKYNVKFKKKYGQNFLKDINIVKKIVKVSEIDKNSLVIEVGVGGAVLTKELAQIANFVLAYEIDKDLEIEINERIKDFSNIKVIYKDFLEVNLLEELKDINYKKIFFVSNLPYYITTPIVLKLLNSNINFNKITVMVQKEVGERFSTKNNNKEYSSISVLLQYYYDIKKEFIVSKNEFIPKPNVDSMVISFKERENKEYLKSREFFEKLIRDSFQYKRKNIKNNLKKYDLKIVENILKEDGFMLTDRSEQLPVSTFVKLANKLYK